jgi:hypothetical protein
MFKSTFGRSTRRASTKTHPDQFSDALCHRKLVTAALLPLNMARARLSELSTLRLFDTKIIYWTQ